MVTITPFGRHGPWVGRPWTEFTLQAACGSIGKRGLPERPPLAAGGRIGEWVAGTYAALGGAGRAARGAALRAGRGRRRGHPRLHGRHHDDLPVGLRVVLRLARRSRGPDGASNFRPSSRRATAASSSRPTAPSSSRTSSCSWNVPTFSTTPSWRRWASASRAATSSSRPSGHTPARKTSAELLDEAAAFRIPAAPVLDAPGVLAFEHFADRDVFVPSPSGRFVQPRVPYRIAGFAPRPFAPAPARGADDGAVEWAGPAVRRPRAPDDAWQLPLARGEGRRPHRVVGGAIGDPCARRARRRRGQGRVGGPAGPDAARRHPSPARRRLVGVGPHLPRRQPRPNAT